jgi:hypothetical protein
MTQDNQIIVQPPQSATLTELQQQVDHLISNRSYIIEKVKPLLIEQVDIYTLPGMTKPSLGKPGAEKLAAIFKLRASFRVDQETMTAIGQAAAGRQFIAYVCTLTHDGNFTGEGRGATFVDWERTQYANMNAQAFEAHKRANDLKEGDYQEATGKFGKYYRVKSGKVFDQLALNKAIKMAQKSAFVDAVIRATGMSDLFTQDIEDMREEPAMTEPTPEAMPQHETPTQPQEARTVACERQGCGGTLILRKGARGTFYGCSSYPKCDNTRPYESTGNH